MFDPTSYLASGRWGYICVHTGADYNFPPKHILYNPLRWQIGIGRTRPCKIVINKGGMLQRKWSNFARRLWPRRRAER
jgi:hypothetical protein